MANVNQKMASILAGRRMNQLLSAKLVQLKAAAAECDTATPAAEPEPTREEQLAARVMAALNSLGVTASQVETVLAADGEGEPAEPAADPEVPQDAPITEEEIMAGCRAILGELGIEVEEDEEDEAGDEVEEDELLDQINELTARVLQGCQGNVKRSFRVASRLTASLNLALVAAGKDCN